jgi:hypothetical protein
MTGKRAVAASLLALTLAMGVSSALAASGTALGVKPQAEAAKDGSTRTLVVGADVSIGELVRTGPAGQVQIMFSDRTELVVGPNSALLIEDYLLRNDQSAGKFAVNALAGTFRFATGTASKDRYLISTPTGTIGVRGTEFDFNVDAQGTEVLLYKGAVILCNLSNQCVTLSGTCEIGTYDLSQSNIIGPAQGTTGQQRNDLKDRFMYAENQGPLDRQFWVQGARECFNQGFVNEVSEPLVQGNSGDGVDEPPCKYESYCDDHYGG